MKISPMDIQRQAFGRKMRGLDADEVRAYLNIVAEEVAKVYPEWVARAETGEVLSVKYEELIPMLLYEIQRQRVEFGAQNAKLDARNESLQTALEEFEVGGIQTNIPFLRKLVASKEYVAGDFHTGFVPIFLQEQNG